MTCRHGRHEHQQHLNLPPSLLPFAYFKLADCRAHCSVKKQDTLMLVNVQAHSAGERGQVLFVEKRG